MIRQEDNRKRGRASRNKGAGAERELASLIRDNYGYPVHRGKVFYCESDLVGLTGIHPEVKRVERLNVHRRDRGGWLVTMRLEDWIDLYGAWIE